jgi:hypothetical protein
MKCKTISIRLNLDKLTDWKANEILMKLPKRCKGEYIRNAIIAYDDYAKLLELMKQSLTEVLDKYESKQAGKKNEPSKTEDNFYDYLKSL